MSDHDLWPGIARRLSALVDAREFETWLRPLRLRLEQGRARLTVPNRFFADWISEHYLGEIKQSMQQETGESLEVVFEVSPQEQGGQPLTPTVAKAPRRELSLNPAYTFDSFVVGPCNELAYAACRAVADQPGAQYNPLMIFGGSGLGKTHLVTSVGNEMLGKDPGLRVHYTSSEAYSNEMIQSVRFGGIQGFRDRYRQVDCLIIDDIQFLSGRERTQEEFFHTFDYLFQGGKQIILTSDKMPRDIPGLAGRLRTRFEWGLPADLQPPDEETKIAILQRKAVEKKTVLSRQVAAYLARQPESSVRVLEGYLNRLMAVSQLQGVEPDLELARQVVGPLVSERQVSVEEVITAVAVHYGLKVADLKGDRKTRDISHPRQVAMYLARRLTRSSFPEIGRAMGGKDHSTVVKGVKRVQQAAEEDPELAETLRSVERSIQDGRRPG
ncbi:MAG: chromosomal replication initiator protein DnaA [Desulfarculus sp.]|nr:MAG: chromosomal replication initiator protein DnaA [Desulfarculus sp.]